jgi:hypothetical protein
MLKSVSKMQLVPVDQLLQRVALNEKAPSAIETANVQFRMEQVLRDSQLPPDVKVKLVNDLLLKEQSLNDNKSPRPPAIVPQPSIATAPPVFAPSSPGPAAQPTTSEFSTLTPTVISSLLPKSNKNRAERLLNFIQPSVNWNDKGQLKDDEGSVIPGTNIVDLVRYSLNTGKSVVKRRQPVGWHEFKGTLERANVPDALAPGLYIDNDARAARLKRKPSTSPAQSAKSKQPRVSVRTLRANPAKVNRWQAY